MNMLTIYKINRIVTAKRMGVEPAYLDTAGDAPQWYGIDIRRYELRDIMSVMNAAINVKRTAGIEVFPL